MRRLLAIAFSLLALPAMAQSLLTTDEMLRSSVQNVIRPGIKMFSNRAVELKTAMELLCTEPMAETLDAARESFGAAATAYGRIEFVRVGPLMDNNRADRLLFFPDRKGIGLRQVQAILAEEDGSATAVESLQAKSVAAQGFAALEFVLFGTGAETLATGNGFRCAFGETIAENISAIAGELVEGWAEPEGIARHLTLPNPSYADYRTQTEALEEIVGLVSHGIEAVRDARVNPFIGREGASPKPKQALFWRSGLTMPMLRANLEGMRQLVRLSGVAQDAQLNAEIDAAFGRALVAIEKVTDPVEQAVTDPAQLAALGELVVATRDLQELVGEKLSASLGLSVGFSSMDGD